MKSSEILRMFAALSDQANFIFIPGNVEFHYLNMVLCGQVAEGFDHSLTLICLAAAIAESEGH